MLCLLLFIQVVSNIILTPRGVDAKSLFAVISQIQLHNEKMEIL